MNKTTIKCSGCKHLEIVSGGGWCHAIYSCSGENYAEREESKIEQKNMSDKIQMTEEQYKNMSRDIWGACTDAELHVAKQKGYIIKSDLQQKIEEVETAFELGCIDYLHEELYKTIQLLKQSHPEFKK